MALRLFPSLGVLLLTFTATVRAATLLYVEKNKEECSVKTMDFPAKTETTILTLQKNCPNNIIWEDKTRLLYYTDATGGVFSHTLDKNPPETKSYGSLPPAGLEIWVDELGGALMAVSLLEISPKDVKMVKEKSGLVYTYYFEEKYHSARNLPEGGSAYMSQYSAFADDKWHRLYIKPTKVDMEHAPNHFVQSAYGDRRESGVVVNTILKNVTCSGTLNCDVEEASVKKALGKKDGYGTAPTMKGIGVFFPVSHGKTPHAVTPAILCRGTCEKPIKLKDITVSEISVSVSPDTEFFFVAREFTNEGPVVFEGRRAGVIIKLPKAHSAIWLK